MSKEARRVHPRVSYEQRIRLLGADGKPVIVGRTMNISPSGIYVRAPNGCEVGSEVTCDLPLPRGVRPPVMKAPEPPVVTAFDEPADVTAIVAPTSAWRAVMGRIESLHAWGFVAVATVTFAIVYVAINRRVPDRKAVAETPAGASIARPDEQAGEVARRAPLVVPSAMPAAPVQPQPVVAMAESTASDQEPAKAARPARPHARAASTKARPGWPFDFDEASGRYQLRAGASIDMKGAPLLGLGGLSASEEGGGNLRGINAAVESGALFLSVSLPHAEADARFAVQVTPSWPTPLAIVGKTTTGFTVSFGTPAPADAHLDWFLIR